MTIVTTLPRLASRAERLTGSVIDASTSLLARQTHDIVTFAMGAPSGELIPAGDLSRLLGRSGADSFGYAASEGTPELLEQVGALTAREGAPTSAERLVITSGGMQGLDIAFKLLLDPGDAVIVEAPSYTNGIGTAASYEARILEAPVDDGGMVVEALPGIVERAGVTPKAIYTIPNFQNPSGTTLTRERRLLLLELAERWDAAIVADDPYGALRFEGERVPSFAELSPGNPRLIQVRTFSKILAPGLRLGWIDLDPALRQRAISAKQAMDTCTAASIQRAVASYLAEGLLEPHLETLREVYRGRKEAMVTAVRERFGKEASVTDPDGGIFLWLTLGGRYAGVDTEDFFAEALRAGVAYIPGPAFTDSRTFRHALRLCYATALPERIAEGIDRLARALDARVSGGGGKEPE